MQCFYSILLFFLSFYLFYLYMILDNSINYDGQNIFSHIKSTLKCEITLRYDTIIFFSFQKAQTFTHTKEIKYININIINLSYFIPYHFSLCSGFVSLYMIILCLFRNGQVFKEYVCKVQGKFPR